MENKTEFTTQELKDLLNNVNLFNILANNINNYGDGKCNKYGNVKELANKIYLMIREREQENNE
jgi:hypothetical protein